MTTDWWAVAGPLFGVALGSGLSLFGASRQAARDEARALAVSKQEHELALERTRREYRDRVYVELEERRFSLASELEMLVQLRSPSGALVALDVPQDLSVFYESDRAFSAVARKGALYFSETVNAALREVQRKLATVKSVAQRPPGSKDGVDRTLVMNQVSPALSALSDLRSAMRDDVQRRSPADI